MSGALGISQRNNRGGFDRNSRGDRGRSIRYQAGRISRGESPRNILSNEDICRLNRTVLREAYGDGRQAPTQEIAEDAGQSKKAAENWWNGENPQGLTAFVNAYRNNPRFAAFARYYLLGHTEHDPILEIQLRNAMDNMGAAASQLGMPQRQFAAAMAYALGHGIDPHLIDPNATDADMADADDGTGDLFGGLHD
ncbi:MAG: hypothetical protein WDM91_11085 [Rhizomicrobium sp.]